jgi:hypothetical protein
VFAETPEFNPEAAAIQVVPEDAQKFVFEAAARSGAVHVPSAVGA